jgi:predicted transcriptional regulator
VSKGITRARQPEVDQHVVTIADMMRSLAWKRGESNRELAKEWGVSVAAVNDYAAEASRRVRAEVTDVGEVTGTVATVLAGNLERASEAREYGDVAKLADVWTRITGARAPERHEHAVVIAQFEALPRDGKLRWIRERIAKLQAAEAALLGAGEQV